MIIVAPGPEFDLYVYCHLEANELVITHFYKFELKANSEVKYDYYYFFGIIQLAVDDTVLIRNLRTGFIDEFNIRHRGATTFETVIKSWFLGRST